MFKANLSKKQKFAVIGSAVLIIIALFFLLNYDYFTIKVAEKNLRVRLIAECKTMPLQETGKGKIYDYYLRSIILGNIMQFESSGGALVNDNKNIAMIAEEIENLFIQQCKNNAENCHPYYVVMPYCMHQRSHASSTGLDKNTFKETMLENEVFSDSMNYWRQALGEKELGAKDIDSVLGYIVSERLCGKIEKIDSKKWIDRVLKIDAANLPTEERLAFQSRAISVVSELYNRAVSISEIPSNEAVISFCKELSLKEDVSKMSVCAASNYYRSAIFCGRKVELNFYQIKNFLETKYSNPEELICQINLLRIISIHLS